VLGLFDSGLGGLTVLKAVRGLAPSEDIVYFADQAHVPYGERTDADLIRLLGENLAFLERFPIAGIVMACNTSCAIGGTYGWPRTRVPVLDLIDNAARGLSGSAYRRVVVIATQATVRSGAYARAIARYAPHITVQEIAAPALVPLVESGAAASAEARVAVADVVAHIAGPIDAVMLGCTHYPLLIDHFRALLPAETAIVDPALAQAAVAAALGTRVGDGTTRYVTNGDLHRFATNVRAWMNDPLADVAAAERLSV